MTLLSVTQEAFKPKSRQSGDGPVDLAQRLIDARSDTDRLFDIVRPEALYDRPIAERHRIVFYIGHLEAFDWNLFSSTLLGLPTFDERLDKLFAFGIDPVDGGLPSDQPADWPDLAEVRGYVARTREEIDRALASCTAPSDDPERYSQILNVAIEHRLMHAETLAYMLHRLPVARKRSLPIDADLPVPTPAYGSIAIAAGVATLGRAKGFGWDNEFAEHAVEVPAFAIDRYKVTNRQFLAFVEAGGYSDRLLWSDSGWAWRTRAGIEHPGFWTGGAAAWHYLGMFGERPLPMDWPVFVSHAEASAYARWSGKSLPSEVQFHRAAYGVPKGRERLYPWGDEPPAAKHGNFDFERWDPAPVNAYPAGDSAFGVGGLVGNGWEWTSTVFAPFKGFERFPFYPGYSADFFDGKHFVMKGGSMRTANCMLRRSFRNWFQGNYPHAYAGFRCVEN